MNEIDKKEELLNSADDFLVDGKDVNDVLQKSVDIVVKVFGYESAVSFVNDEKAQRVCSRTYANGSTSRFAVSFLKIPFDTLFVNYTNERNLVVQTILGQKIKQSNKLMDYMTPIVSDSMAKVLQIVGKVKYIVSVPIVIQGKCFGAIMVVKNKDEEFNAEERDLLKSFTKRVATAIKKIDATTV
jgi:transcriptional regulator with GAF, ATPase, and Fis domain